MFAESDVSDDALHLWVGYDPEGNKEFYRSRSDYEPTPGRNLASTPSPPSGMRFGEANWSRGQKQLEIKWYGDFGKWLRENYSEVSTSQTNQISVDASEDDPDALERADALEREADAVARVEDEAGAPLE